MNQHQFAALAELLRLRGGPAQDAARLVFVNGCTVTEAAQSTGITLQAASNAAQRCRKGLRLARLASGLPSDSNKR